MHISWVSNRSIRSSWQLLSGACVVLGSSHALAAAGSVCTDDADCGDGYSCEVTGASGSCSGQACAKGETCPPPVCETFEIHSCVPGPCSADSDCVDNMVCHTSTYATCSGSGRVCKPGEACPPPPPPTCSEYTESQCTPRYQLPCRADADCGTGFRCTEELVFKCEGGTAAGDPRSSPGTAVDGPPAVDAGVAITSTQPVTLPGPSGVRDGGSSCTEVPSGQFSCQLLRLPCTTDASCPSGMQCESEVPCTPKPSPAGSSGAAIDSSGCAALLDEPTYVCRPPSYATGISGWPGQNAGDPDGTGGTTGGGSKGPVDAGSSAGPGTSTPPSGDSGDDDSSDSDSDSDTPHGSGHPRRHHGAFWPWLGLRHGCSLAGPSDDALGESLSLLLGLGLVVGLRRRRPRPSAS